MTNMRRGFTMIELIFVIVIIGILAAVAIPKLAGTATKARESVHEGFIGTLNRSVGPAMWADVVNDPNAPGSVKTLNYLSYTDLPEGVTNFNLAGCGTPTPAVPGQDAVYAADGVTVITPAVAPVPATTGFVKIADITNLERPASIYCLDGTGVASPQFGFDVNGAENIVYE